MRAGEQQFELVGRGHVAGHIIHEHGFDGGHRWQRRELRSKTVGGPEFVIRKSRSGVSAAISGNCSMRCVAMPQTYSAKPRRKRAVRNTGGPSTHFKR